MEEKKNDSVKIADSVKKAVEVYEQKKDKIINLADQNNDGRLDYKDVIIAAATIGGAAKDIAATTIKNAKEKSKISEYNQLSPIFPNDMNSPDFIMPKLIYITKVDKKHSDSELCKGSFGHISEYKNLMIANVYRDHLLSCGIQFTPDAEDEIYYVDPSDRNHYIALDKYFNYLKIEFVNELQRIAQKLGARHFTVCFNDKESSSTETSVKAKMKAKDKSKKQNSDIDGEHSSHSSKTNSVEIVADCYFPGHAPERPELKYLKNVPEIQNLITMRMNESSPLQKQSYSLSLITSSGIKEKDALKIDLLLQSLKLSSNISVATKIKEESQRYYKYEVGF